MTRRDLMTSARCAQYLGYASGADDTKGIHAFRQARVRLGLPTIYLSDSPRDMRFDPVEIDAWVDARNARKAAAGQSRSGRARHQHAPQRTAPPSSGLHEVPRETRGLVSA